MPEDKKNIAESFDINKMITGTSKSSQDLKKLIQMVSKTNSTALVLGETGTGKDIIAQAIHICSNRKGSFVTVNCAAIPTELLESELFGHEKGAFTGADRLRKGRFEQSNEGTMFLDEIGDMPLPLQAKLLRAIENKTIQRVGGSEDIKINLRLICATHRDLEKKVEIDSSNKRGFRFCRLRANQIRSIESKSDYFIFLEVCSGSFKDSDTIWITK
mgnify:CR=1 FL=1